jgi:acetylornithine deacetylase
MRAQDVLRELVAIPSVSKLSNRAVMEKVQSYFAGAQWHQRVLGYRDDAGVQKLNLIVSSTPMDEGRVEAELAIVCHTDTVPYGEEWAEATTLIERGGMLHGCGACDVKGFAACMIAAAAGVDVARLTKRFCFVFTADEEVGCKGAKFLLAQDALRARYAIVGEPTSLVPARAGKGYCLASVRVHGKAAHSAYPEAGRSAIFAAARLLNEIEKLGEELKLARNEAFSPPWTTLNVGEIRGGTAKNVVAAECSFLVEWRPVPGQAPELVLERLRETVAALEADVDVLRMDVGFETSAESAVLKAVVGADGDSQTIAFGTEAPWLAKMGAEAVVMGPGSMLTAHSPRECVPKEELDRCVQMLQAAIEQLCG